MKTQYRSKVFDYEKNEPVIFRKLREYFGTNRFNKLTDKEKYLVMEAYFAYNKLGNNELYMDWFVVLALLILGFIWGVIVCGLSK